MSCPGFEDTSCPGIDEWSCAGIDDMSCPGAAEDGDAADAADAAGGVPGVACALARTGIADSMAAASGEERITGFIGVYIEKLDR
jgi:hypothetical protein